MFEIFIRILAFFVGLVVGMSLPRLVVGMSLPRKRENCGDKRCDS